MAGLALPRRVTHPPAPRFRAASLVRARLESDGRLVGHVTYQAPASAFGSARISGVSTLDARRAAFAFAALLGVAALQNAAVLLALAPPRIVMGGRFPERTPELTTMLFVALGVLAVFVAIVLLRAGVLPGPKRHPVVRGATWLVAGYLLLNTLGNLAGTTWFERGMAVVTFLAAGLAVVVARSRHDS